MTAGTSAGRLPLRAALLLGMAILIWGSTWTVIRYQIGVVDPAWSAAYRFTVATAVMGLFARWQGASLRIGTGDLPLLAAIGLTQFSLNFLFIYHAEGYVTSGLVAMIFASMIISNAVLGWLFMGHRFSRSFIFGSLLAVAGLVLLFRQEIVVAAAGGSHATFGIGLSLLGMISASAGNMFQSAKRAHGFHWATLLFWAMGFGALINAAVALVMAGAPTFDPQPAYWLSVLYLGLFGSAITFPIYLSALRIIGPSRAAYTGVLIPIVAMILSTFLEDYHWSASAIAGAALALLGLVFALRGKAGA